MADKFYEKRLPTTNASSSSPISMKYKSSNHITFGLSKDSMTSNGITAKSQKILPIKKGSIYKISNQSADYGYIYYLDQYEYPWEKNYSPSDKVKWVV